MTFQTDFGMTDGAIQLLGLNSGEDDRPWVPDPHDSVEASTKVSTPMWNQRRNRELLMTGVGSAVAARSADQQTRGGAIPTSTLHDLQVSPIPFRVAKTMLVNSHYLHSLPGGTQLAFGVFLGSRLMGALTIGCGPSLAYRLIDGASIDDCAVLTRLWLSDELPPNSESRVIGITLRALRRNTSLKFLLSYADPTQGHVGTIYQATNWLYTGVSQAMPLYDLGDGVSRHSRSLAHAFGTHSLKYFRSRGVGVKTVEQSGKHRYVYFLEPAWRKRLRATVFPYPNAEEGICK